MTAMANSGILIQVPGSNRALGGSMTITPAGGLGFGSGRGADHEQNVSYVHQGGVGGVMMDQQQQISLVELGKRLLSAARDGECDEVSNLIAKGAPFTTDWLGTSPLHLAAQYGHSATCERLLTAGISKDARTKVDKTPLHIAAQEDHSDVVELLLRYKADIEAVDLLHMTPLHWAVERGNVVSVEILLRYGADVNIESKFNKTPLEIASDNGRPDIFEMLQNPESYRQVELLPQESDPVTLAATNSIIMSPTSTNIVNQLIQNQVDEQMETEEEENLEEIKEKGMSREKALKVLEACGITLMPEEGHSPKELETQAEKDENEQDLTSTKVSSPSVTTSKVSLTEAGKLALNVSSPSKKLAPKIVQLGSTADSTAAGSGSITKISTVSLASVPSVTGSGKQPRVIKLTAAQFAALKAGKGAKLGPIAGLTSGNKVITSISTTPASSLPGQVKFVSANSVVGGPKKTMQIIRVAASSAASATTTTTNSNNIIANRISSGNSKNVIDSEVMQKELQDARKETEDARKETQELKEQMLKQKKEMEEQMLKTQREMEEMKKLVEGLKDKSNN